MLNEFWKYWKQRWPLASQNEEVLIHSANYRETKAAFEAGYQAAEQSVQRIGLQCGHEYAQFIESAWHCGVCGKPANR